MQKYLFEATFKDGTIFKQTKEDISATDPKRNCFYDIAKRINELKLFSLIEQIPIFPKCYIVNLIDGSFEINGCQIQLGWNNLLDNPPDIAIPPFKLIYYTQVKQHTKITYQLKTGKILKHEPAGTDRIYFIGWETKNNKGKKIKRTIGFN